MFGHLVSPTQLSRSCFGLQLHKQHAQLEPERHTWHRRESDESGESAHEELEAQRGGPVPIPRSASYPFSSPRQPAEETATLQTGFQRRYGGITGKEPGQRSEFRLGNQCPLWTGTSSLPATRHWQFHR